MCAIVAECAGRQEGSIYCSVGSDTKTDAIEQRGDNHAFGAEIDDRSLPQNPRHKWPCITDLGPTCPTHLDNT